jgi:hypothetical protein
MYPRLVYLTEDSVSMDLMGLSIFLSIVWVNIIRPACLIVEISIIKGHEFPFSRRGFMYELVGCENFLWVIRQTLLKYLLHR